jgi:hypothetical protein
MDEMGCFEFWSFYVDIDVIQVYSVAVDGHMSSCLGDLSEKIENIVTCGVVCVMEMMGSSLDDWILLALQLQPLLVALTYSAIAISHTLQSTVAHALGFCLH